MKAISLAATLTILQIAVAPAWAAGELSIERMATCRDSWLDWKKTDPARMREFGDQFRSDFSRNESDPFFVPRSRKSVAGLRVARVFPESVGMGVGFSVVVDAPFAESRRSLERMLGKPLEKCDVGDNMRTCELEIAERRTLMVMAEDNPKATTTLLGCYYYYEK